MLRRDFLKLGLGGLTLPDLIAPLAARFSFSRIFGGERLRGKRGAGRAEQNNGEQQTCGRLSHGVFLPNDKGSRSVYQAIALKRNKSRRPIPRRRALSRVGRRGEGWLFLPNRLAFVPCRESDWILAVPVQQPTHKRIPTSEN